MSIDALMAWTNSGLESQRRSGCSRRYSGSAVSRSPDTAARYSATQPHGQHVGAARDPADGTRHGELQQDVVGADQQVEPRGLLGDLVRPADVTAELLDGDDGTVGVELGEQPRCQVDLGVVRIVVRDDRQARGGDFRVVRTDRPVLARVPVGRQQQDG